jgi:hypothetical protein
MHIPFYANIFIPGYVTLAPLKHNHFLFHIWDPCCCLAFLCIPSVHHLCAHCACSLPLPGPRLHTDAISTAPCALRAAVLPCALQQHTAWALLKDDNGQPDEAAIQAAQQAGLLPGEVPIWGAQHVHYCLQG